MKTIKIAIAVWIIAGIIAGLFGEVSIAGELGTTTAGFLRIGVGARALGMGGAFASVADNPSAVYWNPAGLCGIDRSEAEFSHQSWYQDMAIENLQVAFPLQKVSLGAGLTYVNLGTLQSYDESGNPGEELSLYNMALAVSAATKLNDNVSVGVTAKYIEQSFDVVKGRAVAGDIGILAAVRGVNIGAVAVNLGSKITYIDTPEDLPAALRLGISFHQFDGKALVSLEAQSPFAGALSLHQGLEVRFHEQLFARSGLAYRTETVSGENALSYNLGLGLGYGHGRFDYTFIPSDAYGSDAVHNFTISLWW